MFELHIAIKNRDFNKVKQLLKEGADLDELDNECYSPFFWASQVGDIRILKYLIKKGCDFRKSYRGFNALHVAASGGQVCVCRFLIDLGFDVNKKGGHDRRTPLHWVAQEGHCKVAKVLIDHGAKINVQTAEGGTPLSMASSENHIDLVKLLIKSGARINLSTKYETALHNACAWNNEEAVKTLIAAGANINKRDKQNRTPLYYAAKKKYKNLIKYLMAKGAKK